MVINQIISSSVIISALLLGIFSWSLESANADTVFCYDQVGDGNYCFDKKGKCEIANKADSIAESLCYDED